MSKSFQSETRDWHDWSVTIHAVPLTLALLYVCGWDEHYESKFRGRRAWKGYDFPVLDLLTDQGLLEKQGERRRVKSVVLTPKGVKQARKTLKKMNLEGIDDFFLALVDDNNSIEGNDLDDA